MPADQESVLLRDKVNLLLSYNELEDLVFTELLFHGTRQFCPPPAVERHLMIGVRRIDGQMELHGLTYFPALCISLKRVKLLAGIGIWKVP